MDSKILTAAGFELDPGLKKAHEDSAKKNGLSESGPYKVLGVWRRGLVTLLFEQNQADEIVGSGLTARVSHPPVCVITGQNSRVTCNAEDIELILGLASELE